MMRGLRKAVRQYDIGWLKALYRKGVIPAYRALDIPVYDITASRAAGYTWFRIPKNGTHSVMELLKKLGEPEINSSSVPYFPKRYRDTVRFCVLRNPWDRLVSVYANKVEMKLMFPQCWGQDFGYFVDYVGNQDLDTCDAHLRRQTAMFPAGDIDEIVRMESFDTDLRRVMKRIGIEIERVPHIGRVDHQAYQSYYTEILEARVGDMYKRDIDFGSYAF